MNCFTRSKINFFIKNGEMIELTKVDKYEAALEECKTLTRREIIDKYELTNKEINIMEYLYKKQKLKKDLIEYFCKEWLIPKTLTLKVFGSLKKKGLIYSVVGYSGYLGTDIKI